MNIEELGERNRLIPGWIRLLIVLPFAAIAAYWVFGYKGLYALLAEWEIDLFGGYYAFLTGIVTFLICMIPVFPIMAYVRRKYEREGKANTYSSPSKFKLLENHFPNALRWVLVTGIIGAMGICVAGYFLFVGSVRGELTEINMIHLKNGSGPASTYVSFEGIPHTDFTKGISEEISAGRESSTYYVPVLYTSLDKIMKFYCFVEVEEYDYGILSSNDERMVLTGTLSKNSLPGLVREDFGSKLADNYWVLDYGNTPEEELDLAWVFAVVGLISGGLFVLLRHRAIGLLEKNGLI